MKNLVEKSLQQSVNKVEINHLIKGFNYIVSKQITIFQQHKIASVRASPSGVGW
jgi:hypothetical protein